MPRKESTHTGGESLQRVNKFYYLDDMTGAWSGEASPKVKVSGDAIPEVKVRNRWRKFQGVNFPTINEGFLCIFLGGKTVHFMYGKW